MTHPRNTLMLHLLLTLLLTGVTLPAAAQEPQTPTSDEETTPNASTPETPGTDTGAATDTARSSPDGEETEQEQEQEPDLAELQRQLDILAEEVERLRSGEDEPLDAEQARRIGLAPSASATYGIERGVSIAGYGEMLLENFADTTEAGDPTNKTTQLDFLRAILYAGYRFNDKFLFNSEIEVEHADEIFVEFAYVDFRATENFGLRGGMLLVPMGLVNEFHEPTVFIGAERPVTENRIIPTTWRENGGGVYGSYDRVSFRAYAVNGFNGANFSSGGFRGGRQKGSKAKATDMGFAGRFDVFPTPGVFLGVSLFSGGSDQGEIELDGQQVDNVTTIFDVHGQAQFRGLDVRGLFAQSHLSNADELNMALENTGTDGIAERMRGSYIQVGYDVLSQVTNNYGVALMPYVRYEVVDTQSKMPDGFERSLSTDNRFITAGVELKPIPGVVLKIDHAWVSNDANTGINQFNINLGYAF